MKSSANIFKGFLVTLKELRISNTISILLLCIYYFLDTRMTLMLLNLRYLVVLGSQIKWE